MLHHVLLRNDGREANALFGVRLGDGHVWRIIDMGRPKYFATFAQDQINDIYRKTGVAVVEQRCSYGGTPSVEMQLPWIDTILKI